MQAMKILISFSLIWLICACSVWADDVQDELSAREECSAYSEAGMYECLAKKVAESEIILKKAEANVLSGFARWGEDTKYINIAKSKLKASNKAFINYRKAHCAFNASLGGGAIGNALEIGRLACAFELNSRRAKQLDSAIATLPTK